MSQWHRLDPKSTVASGLLMLAPAVPTLGVLVFSGMGGRLVGVLTGVWVAVVVLTIGSSGLEWYLTRYRLTDERFEVRKGGPFRSHRWVPRDRIRSVDVTADPMHRLLRIAVVKIGTGDSTELTLDSLARFRAEDLRQELLRTPMSAGSPTSTTVDEPSEGSVIAQLKAKWLGYGALTVSLVSVVWGAIASAAGSIADVLSSIHMLPDITGGVPALPLWLAILFGVIGVVAAGMLGAVVLSLEMWWKFRLIRERGGTVRVRRGLLTTRSVSLEERRLRGVEYVEPLLLRWAGGARLNAVVTGSAAKGTRAGESKVLMPPAPRDEAKRVAATVLREPTPSVGGELRSHPHAALRRRLVRAAWSVVAILVAVLLATVTGWLPFWVPWLVAAASVLVGPTAAVIAYRNLGHALNEKYLVSRHGWAIRRTVALQRGGIIGWRIQQSFFQRRMNLITVGATTAAGAKVYDITDVSIEKGLELAEEAVPELLTPFLERR